ncbi:Cerato-ulmin [Tolypocladium capitatum]|uniref:Cerato-ulmin n=1 Tax=Tolypocladium capitatum TaxID=45235 RepID=A0A2K3QF74_9HYPO|nr:Cerato-ulmin [Tolypocladium capitatum]
MQFFTIAALLAATAVASPHGGGKSGLCGPGLYSNPLCCNPDVLGVADLDCSVPNMVPNDRNSFEKICTAKGKAPHCCVLPVALLCEKPVGV